MKAIIKGKQGIKAVVEWVNSQIRADLGNRAVIIGLSGPMGAGKTTLVKKLGESWGLKGEEIISPSFVLHAPYNFQWEGEEMILDHIDCWRMENWDEVERLGIGEMIRKRHVLAVEWADKFREQWKKTSAEEGVRWVEVGFRFAADGKKREVEIS